MFWVELYSRRLPALTVVGFLAVLASPGLPRPAYTAASRHAAPALHFVSKSGYRQTVRGDGWSPKHPVVFSLLQGSRVLGFEIQADGKGFFVVGVKKIDLCAGETYAARDWGGHRVVLRGPGLECPIRRNAPVPQLRFLTGSNQPFSAVHVDLPRTKSASVRLGNAIYLWEEGAKTPLFLPSAEAKYLELFGQGKTPPRACPRVECTAGFYWEWAAMKDGSTSIVLDPACRPRCATPSYDVTVTIRGNRAAGG